MLDESFMGITGDIAYPPGLYSLDFQPPRGDVVDVVEGQLDLFAEKVGLVVSEDMRYEDM